MHEEKQSNDNNDNKDSFIVAFGIYGAVGFQLAFAVVGGLYVGHLADKHFGTLPWLTVLGLLLGSTGGFYNLIRIIDWNQRRKEK
jgi:ATP synthase protein I